jgi:hypothetical protein
MTRNKFNSTHCCGLFFLAFFPKYTKDKHWINVSRLAGFIVETLLDVNKAKIVVALLTEKDAPWIPYLEYAGFQIGETGGVTLMSVHLPRGAKAWKCNANPSRAISLLAKERDTIEKTIYTTEHAITTLRRNGSISLGHSLNSIWTLKDMPKTIPALTEYLKSLMPKVLLLEKKINEYFSSVPQEDLGYWKKFVKNNAVPARTRKPRRARKES